MSSWSSRLDSDSEEMVGQVGVGRGGGSVFEGADYQRVRLRFLSRAKRVSSVTSLQCGVLFPKRK